MTCKSLRLYGKLNAYYTKIIKKEKKSKVGTIMQMKYIPSKEKNNSLFLLYY